ncbi:MAG: cellulase family glycosylhydrolase, partial [Chitinophagaceae bacterium]
MIYVNAGEKEMVKREKYIMIAAGEKKSKVILKRLFFLLFVGTAIGAAAQKAKKDHEVYVDKSGVLRHTIRNTEAAYFGVNYTVPFAYGYRSVKRLGITPEAAIDADVYHMARLGFNAFRVHVWDNEITDSAGNLLNNEHLRLFDYLIAKLKERGIKIFLTPLAYWRGGYPEPEPNTGAFSSLYDKREVLVTEAAIKAQEAYLRQLLQHVNPYTKKTYGDDRDVIALEINNEPHHSGPREGVASYINRMITAVRSTGWNKPVFYNISESPAYAGVVAAAEIDGVSFQWYPTGLVAGRTLKGNYLPNVDNYKIPFGDSLPLFRNKAKMVYEFDAGDVAGSYMYPAMARSFRTAGFQWATQFAYDPMATAYANTEYQTHYVNLAYTPSKAISLLIARKAFHQVQRGKKYEAYPADSLFEDFRVSYLADLSEMNSATEFHYSNRTSKKPKDVSKLQHVAGVGSSPIVMYNGSGAYFLDKKADGVWRLEVMPDAVQLRDPFAKASPQKEVVRIQWQAQTMQLQLPHLGTQFSIEGLNEGNRHSATASGGQFTITPGTYLLRSPQKEKETFENYKTNAVALREFVAPQPF